MDVSLTKETDVDDPDNANLAPYEACRPVSQPSRAVANTIAGTIAKTSKQRPCDHSVQPLAALGIDASLVLKMKEALAAPTVLATSDPAKKPTALVIVAQLRFEIAALRAGTAPACNGRRMPWREIGDRLAKTTGLSEDSLRKAYVAETGQRRHSPARAKANSSTPKLQHQHVKIAELPEIRAETARMASSPGDAFGPLFDD